MIVVRQGKFTMAAAVLIYPKGTSCLSPTASGAGGENTGDEPAVLVQCYPPVEKGVPG